MTITETAASRIIRDTEGILPPELWPHPLFQDPVTYPQPRTPLAIEHCDIRLRHARRMPSTGDATPQALLAQTPAFLALIRRWLEQYAPAHPVRAQVARLDRLLEMARSGASSAMIARALAGLADTLPPALQKWLPAVENAAPPSAPALAELACLLLDDAARHIPEIAPRYWRHVYKAAEQALQYNGTADEVRITPVLRWMLSCLQDGARPPEAYVEIGCGALAGAPTLRRAAVMLRAAYPQLSIHGVDVVPLPSAWAHALARHEKILVYQANPVRHCLPRSYDLMLLANVHRHLAREDQQQLLLNLAARLAPEGLLFINWRYGPQRSPTLCLRKTRHQLRLAGEFNCV